MAQNKELIDVYFTPEENDKVQKKIWTLESFKDKYERIKSVQIDSELDELEQSIWERTTENFEERFESFKKAVEKKELGLWKKWMLDTVKDKATQTIEKKKNQLKEDFKNKIKKIPLIWDLLLNAFSWIQESTKVDEKDWFMDKAKKNIFGVLWWLILSMFWYNKLKKELSVIWENKDVDLVEWTQKVWAQIKDGVTKVWDKIKTKIEDKMNDNPEVSVEVRKEKYFTFWTTFVKKLWSENFVPSDNFEFVIEDLKNYKYSELEGLVFDKYSKSKTSKITKDNFEKAKKTILSNDMDIFFDSIFTEKNMLILSKNAKAKEILLSMWIDKDKPNWKQLNIRNLFSLLSLTVYWVFISWVMSIPWIWKTIFEKILDIKSNMPWFDELKNEMKEFTHEYQKEVLPIDILEKITSKKWLNASNSINWKISDFNDITIENKKYVEWLLKFKSIILNKVLQKDKYNLWMINEIKHNLTFWDILNLYLTYKWKINENWNIDGNMKKTILRTWITLLLKRNNDHYKYWWKLVSYFNENKADKEIAKEWILYSLIVKKIIDKLFFDKIVNFIESWWKLVLETSKNNPIKAWLVWALWLLLFKTTSKTVSKLRSLYILAWAASLATAYFLLSKKVSWNSEYKEALQKLSEWLAQVWVNKDVLNKIDSWEDFEMSDYSKTIEQGYEKNPENEILTDLWNIKIEWNNVFLIDNNKQKFKLEFENDVHKMWDLLWTVIWENIDFWSNISKIFKINKAEFVKKDNKQFININDDYFINIHSLVKNWEKYQINIWETAQESILNDVSWMRDFILDGFYFKKV